MDSSPAKSKELDTAAAELPAVGATKHTLPTLPKAMSAPTSSLRIFLISLLLALVVTAAVILATQAPPALDQASLAGIPLTRYPTFNDELVPRLLAGVLYALGPHSVAAANTLLRLVAAFLYLGVAALLSRSLLHTSYARAALLALLIASGFPFLWLSSELLTGALLCLAIWLVVTERSPWLIGACLGTLALTKSEMVLASVAIAVVYLLRRPAGLRRVVGSFTAVVAVLIAPGLALHGLGFFVNRSWSAFGQHYAAMAHQLHLTPDTDPWNHWQQYARATFPGDASVIQVILHHKVAYSYYVALSLVTGLWNTGHAFGLLLPAIAVRIGLRSPLRSVEAWLLVAMVTIVPEVLMAYPHVRYLAKLAPLVIMVPLAEIERRRGGWGIVLTACLVLYGGFEIINRVQTTGLGGWFPD